MYHPSGLFINVDVITLIHNFKPLTFNITEEKGNWEYIFIICAKLGY